MTHKTPPRPYSAPTVARQNISQNDAFTRMAIAAEKTNELLSDLLPLLVRITIAYELQVVSGLQASGIELAKAMHPVETDEPENVDPLAGIPPSERYRFE